MYVCMYVCVYIYIHVYIYIYILTFYLTQKSDILSDVRFGSGPRELASLPHTFVHVLNEDGKPAGVCMCVVFCVCWCVCVCETRKVSCGQEPFKNRF